VGKSRFTVVRMEKHAGYDYYNSFIINNNNNNNNKTNKKTNNTNK